MLKRSAKDAQRLTPPSALWRKVFDSLFGVRRREAAMHESAMRWHLTNAQERLRWLLTTSLTLSAVTKQALAAIRRGSAAVSYETRNDIVLANVEFTTGAGGQTARVKIPLVRSSDANDVGNDAALLDQLHWTRRTALGYLSLARVAAQALSSIDEPTPPEDRERIARGVATILSKRVFQRLPEVAAPTYEQTLAAYNEAVSRFAEL